MLAIKIIISILAGLYSAARGGAWIKFPGQKGLEIVLFAAIGYYFNHWWGLTLAIPVCIWFIETGDIQAAFSAPDANKRRQGVLYGSLIGLVFFAPFFTATWYFGLPCLLLGLICGAMRYLNNPGKYWRSIIEFGYFSIYVLLYLSSL